MAHIHASLGAPIPAPPGRVFALLADYHAGHPSILPERYFAGLVVEQGGTGAGTRGRVGMRILGRARWARMEVEEPEPGRVLAERYPETGIVTTFTVDPAGEGSTVTIETVWDAPGVSGWILGRLFPGYLRKIYAEELANLARAVATAPPAR